MVSLGVDPGIGTMGYGIVAQNGDHLRTLDYGAVFTEPGLPISLRLRHIYQSLIEKMTEHKPDVAAVEKLYFGRNTTTAEMVFQARGVILLAVAAFGLVPYEPKPSEVKLSICGNGAADKAQVQGMVRYLLGLEELPRPDDAADALAIAVAGLSLASYDRRSLVE